MTDSFGTEIHPVPVSITNPADWGDISRTLSEKSGVPSTVDLDSLTSMLSGAIALLFEADRVDDIDLLRGTFSEQVIAQCQRYQGYLEGGRPLSANTYLIGVPNNAINPCIRVRNTITDETTNSESHTVEQFWDLEVNRQTLVGLSSCPHCGAPMKLGELICKYCHTDVRMNITAPLLVVKLETY